MLFGYLLYFVPMRNKDPNFPLRHITDYELNELKEFVEDNILSTNRVKLEGLLEDEIKHRNRKDFERKVKEQADKERRLLERLDITL